MAGGPVHWLENVDGDPNRLRTACGHFEWRTKSGQLLDPNREARSPVTCEACLRALRAVVVKVT